MAFPNCPSQCDLWPLRTKAQIVTYINHLKIQHPIRHPHREVAP